MSLARSAPPTVGFIDAYCESFQDLFVEVRSFERFKAFHLGLISEIPRKTIPAISKVVGYPDFQGLHHFISESPWQVERVRQRRLERLRAALSGRAFTLCIDETGDRKKRESTDYVKRQYIGNLGKIDNGIVCVGAYGVLENMTFPLNFVVFKPKGCLKAEDIHITKPNLAIQLIGEILELGFQIEQVLADSLSGESSDFLNFLASKELNWIVSIRENHGVLMPPGRRIRSTKWSQFDREFSNGKSEEGWIREVIFGKRFSRRFWQIARYDQTGKLTTHWYLMTNLEGNLKKTLGNLYGLRTWIEYGFKQAKNELGWADFRVTDYQRIEKWWELVCSAYTMVSLQLEVLGENVEQKQIPQKQKKNQMMNRNLQAHRWFDPQKGWKNILNNLRLIIQPYVMSALLVGWFEIYSLQAMKEGFQYLIKQMNYFSYLTPF